VRRQNAGLSTSEVNKILCECEQLFAVTTHSKNADISCCPSPAEQWKGLAALDKVTQCLLLNNPAVVLDQLCSPRSCRGLLCVQAPYEKLHLDDVKRCVLL
jgi:hypothetical protein